MAGGKMEINEKIVDQSLAICDEILNSTAEIIQNINDKSRDIKKEWNDKQFKAVEKSINDSLRAMRIARLKIIPIEQNLKDIKECIHEYDQPIY